MSYQPENTTGTRARHKQPIAELNVANEASQRNYAGLKRTLFQPGAPTQHFLDALGGLHANMSPPYPSTMFANSLNLEQCQSSRNEQHSDLLPRQSQPCGVDNIANMESEWLKSSTNDFNQAQPTDAGAGMLWETLGNSSQNSGLDVSFFTIPSDPNVPTWNDESILPHAEPESDSSWTAEDDIGQWQTHYHNELSCFESDDTRMVFLTGSMDPRQRRLIHAMAHVRRLSHMSLGTGKIKRTLISKLAIEALHQDKHCWNPAKSGRHRGLVLNPRLATYRCNPYGSFLIAGALRESLFTQLRELGISVDKCALLNCETSDPFSARNNLHVHFEEPADAAAAVLHAAPLFKYVYHTTSTIDGLRPDALRHDMVAPNLSDGFSASDGQPPMPNPNTSSHVLSSDISLSSRSTNGLHSSQSGDVSASSHTSCQPEPHSDHASGSSNSKRKRLPPGVYDCSSDGWT